MGKLRRHAAGTKPPLYTYRAKILIFAVAAAGAPLAALMAVAASPAEASRLVTPSFVAVAFACAGMALAAIAQALRPVSVMAGVLRRSAETGDATDLPTDLPGEAGRMMADLYDVAARLERFSRRLNDRHQITGLPTREPFLSALADEVARAGRATMVLGVVRFGDYDRLTGVDPEAADRFLAQFAQRLSQALGGARPLAQVDRDCFAVWFGEAVTPESAADELHALAHVLGAAMDGDLFLSPEVGLGAAVHPDDGHEPATLLERALAALPRRGPEAAGKLSFFSTEAAGSARERFGLEQDLRNAVGREQLFLHFQPVVDLAAGQVVGAEALLRWRHPERGLVAPNTFIPILEETGMMEEVGLWVLNTACRQARAWDEAGLAGLRMAVNLSARQFRDPGLNDRIVRTLNRHGLAPGRLELELTETATLADADRTRKLFTALRNLGVGVAIDDFGAGYSNLSTLKNLPFNKLKIDREFVMDVDQKRDSQAICAALIELAKGLGITVMAEGVETREEVETLSRLGCSVYQGFFFARPMPAADFAQTVADPAWQALVASPAQRRRAGLRQRLSA